MYMKGRRVDYRKQVCLQTQVAFQSGFHSKNVSKVIIWIVINSIITNLNPSYQNFCKCVTMSRRVNMLTLKSELYHLTEKNITYRSFLVYNKNKRSMSELAVAISQQPKGQKLSILKAQI